MINNMYSKIITTITLSLVLLPSYADDKSLLAPSKEFTSGDASIETIVVTGRRDNQLAEHLIGAVGRVSPEEIERMGHAHISQAASRLAGVWLSRGNGQELLASVRSPVFTGAGSCAEILTTEDGLPIRPTGMCNVNQLFEVNSEQASALEIWRGPGTVFYGSNAMHGVINSVSPNITRNYLSLQTSSNDYHRAKLGWKGTQGNQEWQIAANGVKDGGFKDESGFDQQKISLKHNWSNNDLSVKTHLSHVNLNQETAGYIKGFESYKDSSLWKTNPNPEAYRDANATRLSSNISGTSTSGTWQITPYVRKSSMTFLQHYLPGQPTESNGQKSAGVQSSYQIPITGDIKLWAGADLEWADMWVEEFQDNPLGVPDNVRYQGQHYDFEVNSKQFAIFANTEWKPLDKVTIEAGLRYEWLDYDYKNNMIDGSTREDGTNCNSNDGSCRYYRPSDRSDKTDDINFQLGIELDLTPATSVYTRLSSAYRAPQINELYRLQKEQEITTIKPEQLDSIEAGVRYRAKQWYVELAVYSMDKDQVIVKDSNSYIVNDGQTSHQGIEWKLRYQLNEDWQVTSTGAWSKHQYTYDRLFNGTTIDGNDIDTAPRWQGGAQLLWEPSEQITAELEWVYLGKYFLDPQNAQGYAGHNIFNLTVQKRYTQWDLRLQITNLSDRRIADRADYAFGSYRYFVGEGRGLSLELKRQF
jgi:outer membrane receptor protein involved in Fe transport